MHIYQMITRTSKTPSVLELIFAQPYLLWGEFNVFSVYSQFNIDFVPPGTHTLLGSQLHEKSHFHMTGYGT